VLSADFPKAQLAASIRAHALAPWPREGLDLRFSAHGPYAGVSGAALCAHRR